MQAALLEQLLQHALALPGAQYDLKWGEVRVAQIEGRMFALASGDSLSYKAADDEFLALTGLPGVTPAPYLARARWIQVTSQQALSADDIRAGIERSYHLVLAKLPRKTQQRYLETP